MISSVSFAVILLLAGVAFGDNGADRLLQGTHSNQSIFTNLTSPYLSYLDDLYTYLEDRINNGTSEQCRKDTKQLIKLAKEGDPEALKILDSNGKPSSGIMEGGVFFIGFYSECVHTSITSHQERVSGTYCMINLQFNNSHEVPHALWVVLAQSPKPPTIAVCVPSSCTEKDVEIASRASIHENFVGVETNVAICHGDVTGLKRDPVALLALVVFGIFFLCAILGSLLEIKQEKSKQQALIASRATLDGEPVTEDSYAPSLASRFFLCFAVKKNLKKLFNVTVGDTITCIHGLRTFTMALIIFGHTYSFGSAGVFFRNPGSLSSAPKNVLSQLFANGTLAVDTFFAISGLLQAYLFLKIKGKGHPLSVFQAIPHRLWRLTPTLGATILFCAGLLRYISSGPNWLSTIQMYDSWCRKNGLINMVYLQNFINTDNMCLSHTWYLADDFQMFLVALVICATYLFSKVFGIILWGLLLLTSILTTAVITAINHYPPIPYVHNLVPLDVVNGYYKAVYIKPYTRMGPYLIGMLAGVYLFKQKDLKKRAIAFLWTLSIVLGLVDIYLMWPANMGILPTNAEAAAYSSLSRNVWGLNIGWLIFACHSGYGGTINSILSWPPLVPLSRLTFNAYLIHPVVMNVYYGSFQNTVDYSFSFLIYSLVGNYILTIIAAIIMTLLFESPFIAMEKNFFPYLKKSLSGVCGSKNNS